MKPDPRVAQTFGRNLKALRAERGLSQPELGNAIGTGKDQISHLERGKRVPRLDTVLLIARALEVDPAELMKGLRP